MPLPCPHPGQTGQKQKEHKTQINWPPETENAAQQARATKDLQGQKPPGIRRDTDGQQDSTHYKNKNHTNGTCPLYNFTCQFRESIIIAHPIHYANFTHKYKKLFFKHKVYFSQINYSKIL